MLHRHLLPDEIDLLVDGEVGFGVAPLKAHVANCPDCRARVAEARQLTDALEHLPHFAPRGAFADRVMARVQVFQPWHVAALDSVRRYVPASGPARALAAGLAVIGALLLTAGGIWATARFDVVMLLTSGVALERARLAVLDAISSTIASVFGEPALAAIQASGLNGIAVGIALLLAMIVTAVLGLRAVATASARRRG